MCSRLTCVPTWLTIAIILKANNCSCTSHLAYPFLCGWASGLLSHLDHHESRCWENRWTICGLLKLGSYITKWMQPYGDAVASRPRGPALGAFYAPLSVRFPVCLGEQQQGSISSLLEEKPLQRYFSLFPGNNLLCSLPFESLSSPYANVIYLSVLEKGPKYHNYSTNHPLGSWKSSF